MDLSYGEEHERFRQEVRDFLEKHRDVAPPPTMGGLVAIKEERVLSWQRLLIENGYAARTIPREYGGYGAEADPLKMVIIEEEFTRVNVSRGIGGQGSGMDAEIRFGMAVSHHPGSRQTLEALFCRIFQIRHDDLSIHCLLQI